MDEKYFTFFLLTNCTITIKYHIVCKCMISFDRYDAGKWQVESLYGIHAMLSYYGASRVACDSIKSTAGSHRTLEGNLQTPNTYFSLCPPPDGHFNYGWVKLDVRYFQLFSAWPLGEPLTSHWCVIMALRSWRVRVIYFVRCFDLKPFALSGISFNG